MLDIIFETMFCEGTAEESELRAALVTDSVTEAADYIKRVVYAAKVSAPAHPSAV